MLIIKNVVFVLFFINSLVAAMYPLSQKPFIDTIESSDEFTRGTYLIVIAKSSLEGTLSAVNYIDFPYFKQTQGYDVEIWDFEGIGSAEALRDSLETYYITNNLLEYVLLIGDFDPDSPGISYPLDSFTISSYNEQQDDVTDHPFTYFEGSPETDDGLHSNYFIGRWSISNTSDLINIVNKTIQYTKMEYVSSSSYVEDALIVAGSYKTVGANSTETFPFNWPVTPVWTSVWLQERLQNFGYSTVDTAFFYMGNMSSTNPVIANTWNDGVGVINYRGWGNAQGWVKPQFFTTDIDNLEITYDLPIVFSFVCNTGDFGNDVDPSFGEKLLRAGSVSGPKGAVAMIGPSDLDTDTRFNNVMCGALWDGLLEGGTHELAQALHAAKQAVAKEFEGISETGQGGTQDIPVFYHHVYGVLGDPSIPVRLQTPSDITVQNMLGQVVDGALNLSDKFLNLRLEDELGQPLQDVVGAVLYDQKLIARGLSNGDGYLDIDLNNIVEVGMELELFLNKAQFLQKKIIVTISENQNNVFSANAYINEPIIFEEIYEIFETTYNWVEINPDDPNKVYDGENLFLTDDAIAKNISIGFDFTYYGNTYSTINISSNGWVAFEAIDIPYFWNFSIPFPMGPSAMLAVFMDDLDDNGKEPFVDNNNNNIYDADVDDFITNCGTVDSPILPCHDYNQNSIYDEGAPFNVFKYYDEVNSRFIVQWDELSNAEDDENCPNCVKETFQLILFNENIGGQDKIIYQYQEIHDIDDGRIGKNGNLSTIGIESPDQNQGIQYLFRGKLDNGTVLSDGELNGKAIQFSGLVSDDCTVGDLNADGSYNVLDIVSLANCVLTATCSGCEGDLNADGSYNVLDIVSLANCVLTATCGSGRVASDVLNIDDATAATFSIEDNHMYITGDGVISGVQMTLQHDLDFAITMTDRAYLADYLTEGNQTRLLVIYPETDALFSYEGDFEITETIVANSQGEISATLPVATTFSVRDVYPNPFNPTTQLDVSMPLGGEIKVGVYNLLGQTIATLASGYMDAGNHTFVWDASSVASGTYFMKIEADGFVETQKLMLVK